MVSCVLTEFHLFAVSVDLSSWPVARLHDVVAKTVFIGCIYHGMHHFLTSIMVVHLSAYVSPGPAYLLHVWHRYNVVCVHIDYAWYRIIKTAMCILLRGRVNVRSAEMELYYPYQLYFYCYWQLLNDRSASCCYIMLFEYANNPSCVQVTLSCFWERKKKGWC